MRNLKSRFRAFWGKFGVGISGILLVVVPALAWALGCNVADAILWTTGVVVLAYTIETQGMRLEIVRQNEIAIQPLVIAVVEERPPRTGSGQYERCFILRNIGRGAGLRVEVKGIELWEGVGWVHAAKLEIRVDCIEPGKEAGADVRVYHDPSGQVQPGSPLYATALLDILDPRVGKVPCSILISYEDISGQPRWSKVQLGKGGVRLLDHGKGVVGLRTTAQARGEMEEQQ